MNKIIKSLVVGAGILGAGGVSADSNKSAIGDNKNQINIQNEIGENMKNGKTFVIGRDTITPVEENNIKGDEESEGMNNLILQEFTREVTAYSALYHKTEYLKKMISGKTINPLNDGCDGFLSSRELCDKRQEFYNSDVGREYIKNIRKFMSVQNIDGSMSDWTIYERSTHDAGYTLAFPISYRNSLTSSQRAAIISSINSSLNSSEADQNSKGVTDTYSFANACQILITQDYSSVSEALVALEGANSGINRVVVFIANMGGNSVALHRYPGESQVNTSSGICYLKLGGSISAKHELEHIEGTGYPDWVTGNYDPDNSEADPHNSDNNSGMAVSPGARNFLNNGDFQTSDVLAANRVDPSTIGVLDCISQIQGSLAVDILKWQVTHDCEYVYCSLQVYENNNKGFYIQVSKDGIIWENLKNDNNEDTIIHYGGLDVSGLHNLSRTFDIKKLYNSKRYIKVVDIPYDGSKGKSSNINTIDLKLCNTNVINVYPIPAQSFIKVDGDQISSVLIYDGSGKLLKSLNDIYSDNLNINIDDLSSGLYFIRINQGNSNSVMVEIVKQ